MRALRPCLTALGLAGVVFTSCACKSSGASTTPSADVVASEHGFTPGSLDVPAGGPGSHKAVTFVRTTDKTCATEVVFPELNLEKKLPLNEIVSIDVPTDAPKRLGFQCGMAMYKGAIVVTSRP